MNRGRRVALVCVLGLIAAGVAHFVDPNGRADALTFLAAGLVLGELLALRLEDGGSLPLSYAVLIVLASSFSLHSYAIAVLSAELVSIVLRISDRSRERIKIFAVRMAVAAATYAAYQAAWHLVGQREEVPSVLFALGAAAAAQVVVDVSMCKVLGLSTSNTTTGSVTASVPRGSWVQETKASG